jgi:hypothetical protein
MSILDYEFPFFLYLPYVPFEFVIGVWILIKDLKRSDHESSSLRTIWPARDASGL